MEIDLKLDDLINLYVGVFRIEHVVSSCYKRLGFDVFARNSGRVDFTIIIPPHLTKLFVSQKINKKNTVLFVCEITSINREDFFVAKRFKKLKENGAFTLSKEDLEGILLEGTQNEQR